jgi:hypothetical protein
MKVTARESTGEQNRIHLSKEITAGLVDRCWEESLVSARQEMVQAKGKERPTDVIGSRKSSQGNSKSGTNEKVGMTRKSWMTRNG